MASTDSVVAGTEVFVPSFPVRPLNRFLCSVGAFPGQVDCPGLTTAPGHFSTGLSCPCTKKRCATIAPGCRELKKNGMDNVEAARDPRAATARAPSSGSGRNPLGSQAGCPLAEGIRSAVWARPIESPLTLRARMR